MCAPDRLPAAPLCLSLPYALIYTIMDYQSAVDYILSFADYERLSRSAVVFDLRRMEMLLDRLGKPQNVAKSVHITGTKGKGSTSAMVASILIQAGYRTGLYTSPHLLSINERIQVDGQNITEDAFARLTGLMKPEVEAVNSFGQYGRLTTFELLTALGFLYFHEMKADFQVLEVGLGGRLDATNVIQKPEVCVITSISYDHTDVLGHTLTQIATEKCGIIKPGCIVVSAPQHPEAMAVIERVCGEKGVRLIRVGEDVTWRRKTSGPEGQSFVLSGVTGAYDLTIPLLGEHQVENAAVAVSAISALMDRGVQISNQSIVRGMAQVSWPGRLQILRRKPCVVVDGAHNADSSNKLMRALKQYFNFQRLFIIFGASLDKDLGGMVAELAPYPHKTIIVRTHHPRAVNPEALVSEFARYGARAEIIEEVPEAVEAALSQANPDDLICATGSLFVVAEVMEYLRKGNNRITNGGV